MLVSIRLRSNPQLLRASENSPSLTLGAKGDGVSQLQEALYDMGYTMTKSFARLKRADGIYGEETVAAVKAFQKANGLVIDGISGRKTLSLIDKLIAANPNLEAPDPLATAFDEASERAKPADFRKRAQW